MSTSTSTREQDGQRLATLIDALKRDGFVILPDHLDPIALQQVKADLEPWLALTPRCEGDFFGWKTTRVSGLLNKAPIVQSMVLDPLILAIASSTLGAQCDCLQLNLTEAIRIHPGERAQVPHRDEEMWPAEKNGAEWLLNVMWALDDFTPENGATRVWPGSHRRKLDRSIDPAQSIPAVMRAGSALIYLGSLTHSGGANHTAGTRTGLVNSYCLGWLRQYENQFLTYPATVVRTFPEPLQRLIGYQIHRPNLGTVNGEDPKRVLDAPGVLRGHKDALPPAIAAELAAMYANRREGP